MSATLRWYPDREGAPLAMPCREGVKTLLWTDKDTDPNCCCVEASSSSSIPVFSLCEDCCQNLIITLSNVETFAEGITISFDLGEPIAKFVEGEAEYQVCTWHASFDPVDYPLLQHTVLIRVTWNRDPLVDERYIYLERWRGDIFPDKYDAIDVIPVDCPEDATFETHEWRNTHNTPATDEIGVVTLSCDEDISPSSSSSSSSTPPGLCDDCCITFHVTFSNLAGSYFDLNGEVMAVPFSGVDPFSGVCVWRGHITVNGTDYRVTLQSMVLHVRIEGSSSASDDGYNFYASSAGVQCPIDTAFDKEESDPYATVTVECIHGGA